MIVSPSLLQIPPNNAAQSSLAGRGPGAHARSEDLPVMVDKSEPRAAIKFGLPLGLRPPAGQTATYKYTTTSTTYAFLGPGPGRCKEGQTNRFAVS